MSQEEAKQELCSLIWSATSEHANKLSQWCDTWLGLIEEDNPSELLVALVVCVRKLMDYKMEPHYCLRLTTRACSLAERMKSEPNTQTAMENLFVTCKQYHGFALIDCGQYETGKRILEEATSDTTTPKTSLFWKSKIWVQDIAQMDHLIQQLLELYKNTNDLIYYDLISLAYLTLAFHFQEHGPLHLFLRTYEQAEEYAKDSQSSTAQARLHALKSSFEMWKNLLFNAGTTVFQNFSPSEETWTANPSHTPFFNMAKMKDAADAAVVARDWKKLNDISSAARKEWRQVSVEPSELSINQTRGIVRHISYLLALRALSFSHLNRHVESALAAEEYHEEIIPSRHSHPDELSIQKVYEVCNNLQAVIVGFVCIGKVVLRYTIDSKETTTVVLQDRAEHLFRNTGFLTSTTTRGTKRCGRVTRSTDVNCANETCFHSRDDIWEWLGQEHVLKKLWEALTSEQRRTLWISMLTTWQNAGVSWKRTTSFDNLSKLLSKLLEEVDSDPGSVKETLLKKMQLLDCPRCIYPESNIDDDTLEEFWNLMKPKTMWEQLTEDIKGDWGKLLRSPLIKRESCVTGKLKEKLKASNGAEASILSAVDDLLLRHQHGVHLCYNRANFDLDKLWEQNYLPQALKSHMQTPSLCARWFTSIHCPGYAGDQPEVNKLLEDNTEISRRTLSLPLANRMALIDCYHLLFQSLNLQDKQRVIIIPDRDLHLVPFQSLITDENTAEEQFLLEKYEISFSASISSLIRQQANLAQQKQGQGQDIAVLLGAPEPDQMPSEFEGQGLSGSKTELDAVGELLRRHFKIRKYTKSTTVKNLDLTDATIWHVVTHGKCNMENVSDLEFNGGLALSGKTFLLAKEIAAMDLSSLKLCFLNACNTHQGDKEKTVPEGGPLSTANACVAAGVTAVIATLWEADDDAGPLLAKSFYKSLISGNTVSQSMRLACLELLESEKFYFPVYWALYKCNGYSMFTL